MIMNHRPAASFMQAFLEVKQFSLIVAQYKYTLWRMYAFVRLVNI